jgi:streptogramin lyase
MNIKKHFFLLLSLLILQNTFSQKKNLWKGYFSYSEIKDISESSTKIYAASENAIFSKELLSGNVKTTNTIDGLQGQTISSIYHSENFKKTLIGYENGLMIVINEVDGSILTVVDIVNKSISQSIKKINHFMEYEGIVYISCDFGIVQYNPLTLQFGDTYFIGNNGAQISVRQTAIYQNKIYAATFLNGMRSASITNPNLNDFNQWTTLDGNGWSGVETIGNNLVGVSNTGFLYTWLGTFWGNQINLLQIATDIRKNGDYLIVSTKNQIYIYNPTLNQIATINSNQILDFEAQFTCATIINDMVYIGTKTNGVLTKKLNDVSFQNITPDGPSKNAIFSVNASSKNTWVVYGGYPNNYNPYEFYEPLAKFGISKYNNKGWLNISYDELLGAKALTRVAVNPNNDEQVFVSSYYSGVLKLENNQATNLFTASNTGTDGLQTITGQVPDDIRINVPAFDNQGNLWVTNASVNKALKVLQTNGQWKSYGLQSVNTTGKFEFGALAIDKNGTKWMGTRNNGVVGFNENPNVLIKSFKEEANSGNLPAKGVRAIAVDNRNQLWIGTTNGLRVLSSVDSFFSEEKLETDAIIIVEENLAQELLFQQSIFDIVVDGANNKWIATADSGVFLVSPDGQQTIYHFTIDNSPLPSNSINDIDINGVTGEVFFATDKGMVSFKGTATDASENLNNVYVYPNPVRPEFTGTVKISGLIDKANVKISDIEGNLVYETTSEGGTIEWDTSAFGKYKVASGVYMIFISADDAVETKVKKVMIIR